MGTGLLEQIQITSLNKFSANDGNVLKVISSSSKDFIGFGEIYFSTIYFGSVKAWKKHKKMTMNLVVPFGQVLFVFKDKNNFREEIIGDNNYSRITVPPNITFGFQGLFKGESYILNIANIET